MWIMCFDWCGVELPILRHWCSYYCHYFYSVWVIYLVLLLQPLLPNVSDIVANVYADMQISFLNEWCSISMRTRNWFWQFWIIKTSENWLNVPSKSSSLPFCVCGLGCLLCVFCVWLLSFSHIAMKYRHFKTSVVAMSNTQTQRWHV